MRDFTLLMYQELLDKFIEYEYSFITFEKFLQNKNGIKKCIILRHDIDKKPKSALIMAELEHSLGINSTYYFRIIPQSFDSTIIKKIVTLNHKVGYHYENLSTAKGNFDVAIETFKKDLNTFRRYYPVETICMHGSPLSKWDNKQLWKHNNYRDYGIIGEPYFDIDYNKVAYLTDTGRKWNSSTENIRDTVTTKYNFNYSTTAEIINDIKRNNLPNQILINIHPQRWTNKKLEWIQEMFYQILKNSIKRLIIGIK